jgi:uncharacterized cupin superfamily protein
VAVFRVYTGEDGHSHVEELQAGEALEFGHGEVSIHEVPSGYYNDWHQQPVRTLVFVIAGQLEFEFRSGTTHRANPGDATLFEDFTGTGHNFRISSETPAVTAVIRFDEAR